jgi:lipopolysaccharide biosynthesis glycosyltransferase
MYHNRPTILVCGTQRNYLTEAEILIKSIREIYKKNIEILLFTNFTDYVNPDINEIHIIEKPFFGFPDKVYAIATVPRDRVLYMDCDSLVLDNIDEMFALLNNFDIAAAHAPNRWTYKLENIPEAFPEFNCGIILFKRNEKVNSFLSNWYSEYMRQIDIKLEVPSDDQPPFRELLFLSDLRIATLTPEYNCRFNMGAVVGHSVKILHGRISDFNYVKKFINKGPANTWNNEPGVRYVHYNDPLPKEKNKTGLLKKIKSFILR